MREHVRVHLFGGQKRHRLLKRQNDFNFLEIFSLNEIKVQFICALVLIVKWQKNR